MKKLALRLAILGTLAVTGCQSKPANPTPTPEAEAVHPVVTVHVLPVTQEKLSSTIELTGSVVAQYSVNVTADTSGRVTNMMVDVGHRVAKGQPLFTLDTVATRRQLAVDQASLREAATDDAYQSYSDYISLREQDLVSDMQLSARLPVGQGRL